MLNNTEKSHGQWKHSTSKKRLYRSKKKGRTASKALVFQIADFLLSRPTWDVLHPHHNYVSLSKRQKELLALLQQPNLHSKLQHMQVWKYFCYVVQMRCTKEKMLLPGLTQLFLPSKLFLPGQRFPSAPEGPPPAVDPAPAAWCLGELGPNQPFNKVECGYILSKG